MSANFDKSQRVTFLYTDLYRLYKKGKQAAKKSDPSSGTSGMILKTGEVKVQNYQPVEFLRPKESPVNQIQTKSQKPQPRSGQSKDAEAALVGLRTNLKTLNELQSRLRFMLSELEDLTKK